MADAQRHLMFEHALLPQGFARNVRVALQDGRIAAVEPGAARDGTEFVAGIALPGMPNLHCHAFQRGMAGLAERRGPQNDTFWTWREVMYRFLSRLSPADIEAIAAFAYMEMLERGFTAVAEFHYLHHAPDGTPYADIGELAVRIAAAAATTGIGLTMLPSFYAYGDFGGASAVPGQRRFLNDPTRFMRLVQRTQEIVARLPRARIGIAPHSLRAVTPETLAEVVQAAPDGPVHIHAAEQVKEVEACVAWSGRRPVQWLLDSMPVDRRWCFIHSTHMTQEETRCLAQAGAVAGLCPLTESSLGDGIFNGPDFLAAGGAFGIGTDSNIEIDAAAELRQLEYSQRLAHRGRNVMTLAEGESTGRRLMTTALAGGAQALAQPLGAIAPGHFADFVVLDRDHPDFAATRPELWLDIWIFVAGRDAVRSVYAGGEAVVSQGRHLRRDDIVRAYKSAIKGLLDE